MKIEDIIKELNHSISNKRESKNIESKSTLILHKSIVPHDTIKAYKNVQMCLWYVENKKRYRVLSLNHTIKILSGQEEKVIEEVSKMFLLMLFNWIGSNFYEKVVNGEYGKVEVS